MIIGRAFMHELNVPFPLSLARFFLTQQLIYKNKIEKHNISLDIFLSDTSIARNLHLPGEIKFELHEDPYSFLLIRFWYLCCWKTKNIWGSGPYHHRGIKISELINDWENNIAYWKNPSKTWPWLLAKYDFFHAVCK